jgi:hypothetical protein
MRVLARPSGHVVVTKDTYELENQRAGERTRTADPLFTRQALYQLSYSGVYGLVMPLIVDWSVS